MPRTRHTWVDRRQAPLPHALAGSGLVLLCVTCSTAPPAPGTASRGTLPLPEAWSPAGLSHLPAPRSLTALLAPLAPGSSQTAAPGPLTTLPLRGAAGAGFIGAQRGVARQRPRLHCAASLCGTHCALTPLLEPASRDCTTNLGGLRERTHEQLSLPWLTALRHATDLQAEAVRGVSILTTSDNLFHVKRCPSDRAVPSSFHGWR